MKKLINNAIKEFQYLALKFLKNKKKITLNELSLYSDWPNRLLQLESYGIKYKNIDEVIREYDKEKWNDRLNLYKSKIKWNNVVEFRDFEADEILPRYIYGDYFLLKEKEYNYLQSQLLFYILNKLSFSNLVELGAGYGAMVLDLASKKEFQDKNFFAGDISQNGVTLLKKIASDFNLKVKAHKFNFYNESEYNWIMPNSVVYTCHSYMYIPKITNKIITNLVNTHPRLVINLEPIFPKSNYISDLMNKKYILINDYNTNLKDILYNLKDNNMIEIIVDSVPILGNNPFIPFSIIAWLPKY